MTEAVRVKFCNTSLKVVLPSQSDAVAIRFGIPGPKGVDGPKGSTGPRGEPGPAGAGSTVEGETDDTLVPGAAVFAKSNGHFGLAQADSFPETRFAGISQLSTAPGFLATVVTTGPLELSAGQWDVVTGQVGGLTSGIPYFLSTTVAGMLTTIAPSGTGLFSTKVGKAISSVVLDIDPRNPIKL